MLEGVLAAGSIKGALSPGSQLRGDAASIDFRLQSVARFIGMAVGGGILVLT